MIHRVVMKKGFIVFALFTGLNAYGDWQATDPYETLNKSLSAPTHKLKLRLIDYGFHKPEKLEKMIKASEMIFSQCPQVNLKIEIENIKKANPTQAHEQMAAMRDLPFSLNQKYFDFFKPHLDDHKKGIIDIHLLDYISSTDRERPANQMPFHFGKAFVSYLQDWLYRSIEYTPSHIKPSELSRDSVLLAMKSVSEYEKNSQDRANRSSSSTVQMKSHNTLLAHELGHILLETQKPGLDDIYIDHYCPDEGDTCGENFLMAAGSNPDWIQFQRNSSGELEPILYQGMPMIEASQCEALASHPSVIPLGQVALGVDDDL